MEFKPGQKVRTVSLRRSSPNDQMRDAHRNNEILTIDGRNRDGYYYCTHPDFSGLWSYSVKDLAPFASSVKELDELRKKGEVSDELYLDSLIDLNKQSS